MITRNEIKQLSLKEKILAMEYLWEDISTAMEGEAIPKWHKEILDQRYDRIISGKERTFSLDEIREKYFQKYES